MHVLEALQALINNILFMDVFQNIGPDNSVQISFHEIKDKVNVSIVLSSNNILQSDNILMTS